jgi:hypothetical protein
MSTRRRLLAITGTVGALLGALLVASPSSAASHSGALLVKGPGSVYSGSGALVSEAVSAGATDKFELKVVNTGTTPAQYNVKVVQSGTPADVSLYTGTLVLTPFSSSPDGYYTAPIAPGKSLALVLKVAVPAGTPQGTTQVTVALYSTDGLPLGFVQAQTNVKAPTYGTTATDVFVRQGSQPYVGGSLDSQIATSPAVDVGGSAVFSVKLQNDGPVPASVRGYAVPVSECATFTITDGTTDVTAAMAGNLYATPVLDVHASKAFKVTITRTGAAGCGPYDYLAIYARDPSLTTSHHTIALVPYPAS